MKTQQRHKSAWLSAFKITFWVLFTMILFAVGLVLGAVNILTPDKLTPMVESIANKSLNADINVGKVELSVRGSFPFLNLDVDDLSIISKDILDLPKEARDTLPVWADTLASVRKIHGGINLVKLLRKRIDLHNIEIEAPRVNVVVVNANINNFSIAKSDSVQSAPDTTSIEIPDIRINRFRLLDPQPVRFADLSQNVHLEARIASFGMANVPQESGYLPAYTIDFLGDISAPLFEEIGQQTLNIGLDGTLEWRYKSPYQLGLVDFDFSMFKFAGRINTKIDFSENMTVETFDIKFHPVAVNDLLGMVPERMSNEYSIPRNLDTDAQLVLSAMLERPYLVGSLFLPYANVQLELPECYLKYEQLNLEKASALLNLNFRGGTMDNMVLEMPYINLQGPATQLSVSGRVSDLIGDPLFSGEIHGDMDLGHLPHFVEKAIGATLDGNITADTKIEARPSMFCREYFHKLKVKGDVGLKNIYYLKFDTLTMVSLNNATVKFGTNESVMGRQGQMIDSLLQGVVEVDSAAILVSGLDIRVGKMKLGVGASNSSASADTTLVIPMGGRLSARTFSLYSLSDTAGLRIRDLKGSVSMRRYKGDAHHPTFTFNLGLKRMSVGDNYTRMLLSDGSFRFNMSKLPDNELSKSRRELKKIADTIMRAHPEIPIDSVYILAKDIRRRNRRPGSGMHIQREPSEAEVIDWGTSNVMTSFLLDWAWGGSLKAGSARLFTSSFPIRNLMRNVDIKFNNDSLMLKNIEYKAGRSDFLVSGRITNLKRGLTSKRRPSPVKMHFEMLSDTIEVNEIANAIFLGSAAKSVQIADGKDDDTALQKHIDGEVKEYEDSVGPFVIPSNIDAELSIKANNVIYSDIALRNLVGTILVYEGAINLHDLRASSDVGSVDLTALYSAPTPKDMKFGFGMQLEDFNIKNFLKLVPAVDTIMPLMRDLSGIINANIAATSDIDKSMNLVLPSLKAAIRIEGDSIVFLDQDTFNKVAKWLFFKHKNRNIIDKVTAEMIVDDGEMRLFPFVFDFDRYKLGIQGYNDLNMNFNYHIAVLKSPVPFKFGVNVSGNYDKLKIRLGRARFNEKASVQQVPIVNDTRINLINQIQNVFRRGIKDSNFAEIDISKKPLAEDINLANDTLTAADSIMFRQEGLIP